MASLTDRVKSLEKHLKVYWDADNGEHSVTPVDSTDQDDDKDDEK